MTTIYALLMSIIFSLFPSEKIDCNELSDSRINECVELDYEAKEPYEHDSYQIEFDNEYYWDFPFEELEFNEEEMEG